MDKGWTTEGHGSATRSFANNNFKASNIQQAVKGFTSIGNRAYGNTHLIFVDNLSLISPKKIFKINNNILNLIENLANQTAAPDRKCRTS